jgi:hypothetical protein
MRRTLDLTGATEAVRIDLIRIECVEGDHPPIPFAGVACGEADVPVADRPRSS